MSAVGVAAVTVRYFAAARAAAGVEEEVVPVPPNATVAALSELLTVRNGQLGQVLQKCSFLCDGVAVRNAHVTTAAGHVIDVLPPFAGG